MEVCDGARLVQVSTQVTRLRRALDLDLRDRYALASYPPPATPMLRTDTLAHLASLSNPRVVASGNFATPHALLAAVDAALPAYRLHLLNAQPGLPDREGVRYETCFVGPGMRRHPRLDYLPCRLSLVPVLFGSSCPPDVVVVQTSAPRNGRVSLGIEVNILPAALEAVKRRGGLLLAQMNANMPYTVGDGEFDLDLFDEAIRLDSPLACAAAPALTDEAEAVAGHIAAEVSDGATLQLGIGAIPNALLRQLERRQGLGIWTEMFSDGALGLERAGALDWDRPIVASFAFGGQELYDWMGRCERLQMLRSERVNDPGRIAQQPGMVSVNAALQVDLLDQANASRVGGRIYSGFGGATDFVVGALHASNGRSFTALTSWHAASDRSCIVPLLTEGVTSFQHSFVATERGLARCFGASASEQAANLIAVADPRARESLRSAAAAMGLV